MEAASPKIVLERLKEVWIEIADASVYRELELEKQLWMLTALRTLKRKNSLVASADPPLLWRTKILSLYENHGKPYFKVRVKSTENSDIFSIIVLPCCFNHCD